MNSTPVKYFSLFIIPFTGIHALAQIPTDPGFDSVFCTTQKISGLIGEKGEWEWLQVERQPFTFLINKVDTVSRDRMSQCSADETLVEGSMAKVKKACYRVRNAALSESKLDYGMCVEHWNASGIFRVYCNDHNPIVKFDPNGVFLVHYLTGSLNPRVTEGALYAVGAGVCRLLQ